MDAQKLKAKRAQRRRFRVRKKLYGTPDKPRLCVFRSNLHIYAQLIDDDSGKTKTKFKFKTKTRTPDDIGDETGDRAKF